ncbi:MAG: filamentous hemagglutinin N-terminal domain-containing protein, partial [Betaproteobacteria bacterium]|nr:filamentous hemagglutinin N-terminal domain-containing protein [Betaproteobacteria bacterium]
MRLRSTAADVSPVPRNASGAATSPSSPLRAIPAADVSRRRVARVLLGCLLATSAPSGYALPTGAEVASGSGAVSQSGNALTVQQTSPRLAINWQSFGIGAGESVVFRQPDASSIALNRVLGQDPSLILGSLSANGQVFVLNPNGVLFGPGAQVDV